MSGRIAIVGIGCRFPGEARCAKTLWRLLLEGFDAVTEIQENRWSADQFYSPKRGAIGKSVTRWAGLIDSIDSFDCEFFGISPREAALMDPQQRLLLQVCWEALEDAGQRPSALRGSQAGVFVGGFTLDYMLMQLGSMDLRGVESHTATGSMMTLLANRISYVFGLNGPSITIDTACSSSLVAIHQACRSILSGESDLAIAGGVNALLTPCYTVAESRAGMLSPTGRSRTFDSQADGYTRAEGAGLVVLKSLERALQDGDRIYAVIRSTATNHDGHSEGLTVPSGEAQMALMRTALASAGIRPAQVVYAEAHGTGTPVGDPIEARAIGSVLREGRDGLPDCLIGSIKTNFGHAEAAAGVAGLIKTALIMHHRKVPPHLHVREVNPAIPLDELRLHIPQQIHALPETGELFACVNSFGFGGANAHVILSTPDGEVADVSDDAFRSASLTDPMPASREEADIQSILSASQAEKAPVMTCQHTSASWMLPFSAADETSLAKMAYDLAETLRQGGDETELLDLCYTAALRRDHLSWRACAHGPDRNALIEGLDLLAADSSDEDVRTERAAKGRSSEHGSPPRVFVYTGMGPQWSGMGMTLYQTDPIFRQAMDQVLDLFESLGAPLRRWWVDDPDSSRMEDTEVAQPANFAIQVAVTKWLAHHGIRPDICVGHSAGEPAAAWAAGALDLADAVKVSWTRSHLQQLATGKGGMMALGLSEADAQASILEYGADRLSLAAVNSPVSVTIAGSSEDIDAFTEAMEAAGHFARKLHVKIPYHSVYMDPLEDRLLAELAEITPHPVHTVLYSTVSGELIDGRCLDADYWWKNVRQPVLFEQAVRQIQQQVGSGADWLEIGPHPVLSRSIVETTEDMYSASTRCHHSLNRKREEADSLRMLLATMHVSGHAINWRSLFGHGHFTPLPRRCWKDLRLWFEMPWAQARRTQPPVQPLLSRRMNVMQPTWEADLLAPRLSWLEDHRISGALVLPGAAYVSMAMHAARELYGQADRASMTDIRFERALYWSPDERRTLQISIDQDTHAFVIASRNTADSQASWERHCTGRLRLSRATPGTVPTVAELRHRCQAQEEGDTCYQRLRNLGLEYGEQFRGIETVWHGDNEVLAEIRLPSDAERQLVDFDIHPVTLDLCLQAIAAAIPTSSADGAIYMPVGIGQIRLFGPMSSSLLAHAVLLTTSPDHLAADVVLYNAHNEVAARITGCRIIALRDSNDHQLKQQRLYCIDWKETPFTSGTNTDAQPGQHWVLYGDGDPALTQAVSEQLQAAGMITHSFATAGLAEPGARQRIAVQLESVKGNLAGVIHLQAASCKKDAIDDQAELTLAGLHLIQAVTDHAVNDTRRDSPRLWIVTRSTQQVGNHPVCRPAGASLWGLARVAGHAEQVDIWGGLIDLDERWDSAQEGVWIAHECLGAHEHDEIAWRDGRRHVAHVVRHEQKLDNTPEPRLRSDGTYLVTGGLGALGLTTATWLAGRGAGHIILIGRHGLPSGAEQDESYSEDDALRNRINAVEAMKAGGTNIRIETLDIGDAAAVRKMVAGLRQEGCPPVRGVIHSAGATDNHLLVDIDDTQFMAVFRAKVLGAWNLHHALADEPLDFFVAYSSATVHLASAGQCNYASANSALDALMHWRHGLGLPAQAIGWGPWRDGGLARTLNLLPFFVRRGLFPMNDEQGMAALASLLRGPVQSGMVLGTRWQSFAATSPRSIPAPLIRALVDEEAMQASEPDGTAGNSTQTLRARLDAESDPERQHDALVEGLRLLVSEVMGLREDALGRDDIFTSRGMDSMMAIDIKSRIEQQLPVRVAVVDLLRGASANALAEQLEGQLNSLPSSENDMETLAASLEALPTADLERLLSEVEAR